MDWDDAFANMAHIRGSEAFAGQWAEAASSFRKGAGSIEEIAYGDQSSHRFDLFEPDGAARGLFVFVHGGYWVQTGKSDWSHLAGGALAQGFAACMVGYTRAPNARITSISTEIGTALARAAERVDGPIILAGHSAGAHLALRQICEDSSIHPKILSRLVSVAGISGVYDLRPLLMTELNWVLGLSSQEAAAESPVLRRPKVDVPVTLWVGNQERPEFLRQSRVMEMMWLGLGARMRLIEEPGAHHFSVLDGLSIASSPLLDAILGG